jgi:hypothetical protein
VYDFGGRRESSRGVPTPFGKPIVTYHTSNTRSQVVARRVLLNDAFLVLEQILELEQILVFEQTLVLTSTAFLRLWPHYVTSCVASSKKITFMGVTLRQSCVVS